MRACDVENAVDFSRYYNGSYVGMKVGELIIPLQVAQVADNLVVTRKLEKTKDVVTLNPNYANFTWADLVKVIEFGRPDVGMTFNGSTVGFQSYRTTRQAHKGYRPNEVVVSDFNTWYIRGKNLVLGRYDQVWETFNPRFFAIPEAQAKLERGDCVGLPLNRLFGMYTTPDSKYPLLAYKRWTIGHVLSNGTVKLDKGYTDYAAQVQRELKVATIGDNN